MNWSFEVGYAQGAADFEDEVCVNDEVTHRVLLILRIGCA